MAGTAERQPGIDRLSDRGGRRVPARQLCRLRSATCSLYSVTRPTGATSSACARCSAPRPDPRRTKSRSSSACRPRRRPRISPPPSRSSPSPSPGPTAPNSSAVTGWQLHAGSPRASRTWPSCRSRPPRAASRRRRRPAPITSASTRSTRRAPSPPSTELTVVTGPGICDLPQHADRALGDRGARGRAASMGSVVGSAACRLSARGRLGARRVRRWHVPARAQHRPVDRSRRRAPTTPGSPLTTSVGRPPFGSEILVHRSAAQQCLA